MYNFFAISLLVFGFSLFGMQQEDLCVLESFKKSSMKLPDSPRSGLKLRFESEWLLERELRYHYEPGEWEDKSAHWREICRNIVMNRAQRQSASCVEQELEVPESPTGLFVPKINLDEQKDEADVNLGVDSECLLKQGDDLVLVEDLIVTRCDLISSLAATYLYVVSRIKLLVRYSVGTE